MDREATRNQHAAAAWALASLSPRGAAFLLAEWPTIEGDAPLDVRFAEALGAPSNLGMLHVRLPDASIDEHCARYATIQHPLGDASYERAVLRRREHFEKMRIRALQPTVTVVRRDDDLPGWISVVEVDGTAMSRARVDAMVAARDLIARGRGALRAARLRVPKASPCGRGRAVDGGCVGRRRDAHRRSAGERGGSASRRPAPGRRGLTAAFSSRRRGPRPTA